MKYQNILLVIERSSVQVRWVDFIKINNLRTLEALNALPVHLVSPPGTVFSGAFGATIPDAAAYVPHGQIRATTVGAIINSGGTVVPVPELTRGGNMNYRHVNITEGKVSTFSPLMPNPVPKKQRIQ